MATNNLHDQPIYGNKITETEQELLLFFRTLPDKIKSREIRILRKISTAHRLAIA